MSLYLYSLHSVYFNSDFQSDTAFINLSGSRFGEGSLWNQNWRKSVKYLIKFEIIARFYSLTNIYKSISTIRLSS